METEQLEAVRQRYEFSAWKGINQLDHELSIRDVKPPEGRIEGLDTQQIRRIDPGDGSRLLRMSWEVPDREGTLLLMDIRECPSRDAAHEVMLELLANMQAPDVYRLEEDAPGDIAFSRDPSASLIFARGNVAVSIANGGSEIVPVDQVARVMDEYIMEQG